MLTEIRGELWYCSKGGQKKRVLVNVNHATKRVRVISQPGLGGVKRVTTVFEGRYTSIKATMGVAAICCEPISTHMSQQCNCYTPRSAVNNSTSGKWYPIDISLETQKGNELLHLSTNRKSEFKRWEAFMNQICPAAVPSPPAPPTSDQTKIEELQEENKRQQTEVDTIISAASSAKSEVQKLSLEAEMKDLQRKLDLRGAALREAELERHEEVAFYKREIRLLREVHGLSPTPRDPEGSPQPRNVIVHGMKFRHMLNRIISSEESDRQAIAVLQQKSVTDGHLLLKTILSKLRKSQSLPTGQVGRHVRKAPSSPHSPLSSTSGSPNGKIHYSIVSSLTDDVLERDKALAAEERLLSATAHVERSDLKPWVVVSDTPVSIYPSFPCTEGSELRVVHRGTVLSVSAQSRKSVQVIHEADGYLTCKDDFTQTSEGDWIINQNGANLCIGLKTHYLPPRTPIKHVDISCITKPKVTVAIEGHIRLSKPACIEPILGDGWIVTGSEGVTVRATPSLESRIVGSEPVPFGTTVYITDIMFGRARIVYPLVGWVSISNKRNIIILEKASSQRQGHLERQVVSEREKLETELSSVKEDLLCLTDQLVALQDSTDSQTQTYENNIGNLSSELILSRQEVQAVETERNQRDKDIASLKRNLASQEEKCTAIQKQLESDVDTRRRAYAQLVDEKTEVECELQKSREKITSWEEASSESEDKILRLLSERDDLSKKLLQSDSNSASVAKSVDNLKEELLQSNEQYEILTAEKDLAQSNITSLQQEIQKNSLLRLESENGLRDNIKNLQQQLEEQSALHSTAVDSLSQSQSEQLYVENELRDNIKFLESDISDHKAAYKTSQGKLTDIQKELSQQEETIIKLRKKVSRTTTNSAEEVAELSAQLLELQQELDLKCVEKDECVASLTLDVTRLSGEYKIQTETHESEINSLSDKLSSLQADLESQETSLQETLSREQLLIVSHEEQLVKLQQLEDEKQDLNNLKSKMEVSLQQTVDKENKLIESHEEEISVLNTKVHLLEESNKELIKSHNEEQLKSSSLNETIITLKNNTTILEQQFSDSETVNNSLQLQIEELQTTSSTQSEQETCEFQISIGKVTGELEKKCMELETLKESLQQSRSDRDVSELECSRQADEISCLRETIHQSEVDSNRQVENMNKIRSDNESLQSNCHEQKLIITQLQKELLNSKAIVGTVEENNSLKETITNSKSEIIRNNVLIQSLEEKIRQSDLQRDQQRATIESLTLSNKLLNSGTSDFERQIAVLTAVNNERDTQLGELSNTRQALYTSQQQLLVKEHRIKTLEDNESFSKRSESNSPDRSVHVRQIARLEDKVAIQRKMILKLQQEIDEKEEELSRIYEEKKQIRRLLREEREENDSTGRKTTRLSKALQEMEDRERTLRSRLSKCEVDKSSATDLKQRLKESEAACRVKDQELRRLEEWNAQQVCERAKENEIMWKSEASNTSILGDIISNTTSANCNTIDEEFAIREQNDKLKAKLVEATAKYKNLKRETRSRSAVSSRASSASRSHLSSNLRNAASDIENRWTNTNLDENSFIGKEPDAKPPSSTEKKTYRRSSSLTSVASYVLFGL